MADTQNGTDHGRRLSDLERWRDTHDKWAGEKAERLTRLEERHQYMEHGAVEQEGIIEKMQSQLTSHSRVIWIGTGVMIAVQVIGWALTNSALTGVLKALGK